MSRMSAAQKRTVGTACTGLGACLIALSFVWHSFDTGRGGWSNEDAQALQHAATEFHELSLSTGPTASAEQKQRLADARDAHERLNARRQQAIAAAKWRQWAVRWSGVALVLVGLVMLGQQSRST